jgi:hypothetical protein
LLDVHARILGLLSRRGLLEADTDDALARDAPALSACYEGAVTQRVGLGPHRGRPVLKLGTSLAQHLDTGVESAHLPPRPLSPQGSVAFVRGQEKPP